MRWCLVNASKENNVLGLNDQDQIVLALSVRLLVRMFDLLYAR